MDRSKRMRLKDTTEKAVIGRRGMRWCPWSSRCTRTVNVLAVQVAWWACLASRSTAVRHSSSRLHCRSEHGRPWCSPVCFEREGEGVFLLAVWRAIVAAGSTIPGLSTVGCDSL